MVNPGCMRGIRVSADGKEEFGSLEVKGGDGRWLGEMRCSPLQVRALQCVPLRARLYLEF